MVVIVIIIIIIAEFHCVAVGLWPSTKGFRIFRMSLWLTPISFTRVGWHRWNQATEKSFDTVDYVLINKLSFTKPKIYFNNRNTWNDFRLPSNGNCEIVVHRRSAKGKSIVAKNAIISLFFPMSRKFFKVIMPKVWQKWMWAYKRTTWIKMLGGHYVSVRLRYDKQSLDFYCFEFWGNAE